MEERKSVAQSPEIVNLLDDAAWYVAAHLEEELAGSGDPVTVATLGQALADMRMEIRVSEIDAEWNGNDSPDDEADLEV